VVDSWSKYTYAILRSRVESHRPLPTSSKPCLLTSERSIDSLLRSLQFIHRDMLNVLRHSKRKETSRQQQRLPPLLVSDFQGRESHFKAYASAHLCCQMVCAMVRRGKDVE
jgi:hypothetical protein